MQPAFAHALDPGTKAIQVKVNDGRGVQGEHLAYDQATDNRDAKGLAKL
jgi:hypothetical protein